MSYLGLIQELIGTGKRAQIAEETGIYEHRTWYLILKAGMACAIGLFSLYGSVTPVVRASRGERVFIAVIGVASLAAAISIARGPRRIIVADGLVTAEYPAGRRETWPISDLVAREPGRFTRVSTAVRVRSTGRLAFVVPVDLPGWEVLIATITSAGAA
jgi:hypothetical protein